MNSASLREFHLEGGREGGVRGRARFKEGLYGSDYPLYGFLNNQAV